MKETHHKKHQPSTLTLNQNPPAPGCNRHHQDDMFSSFSSWESGVKTFVCMLLLGMGWIQHQLSKEKIGLKRSWSVFFKCRFSTKNGSFPVVWQILNFDDFQYEPFQKNLRKTTVALGKKVLGEPGEDNILRKPTFSMISICRHGCTLFFSESDVCRICMSYDLIWKVDIPREQETKHIIHDTVTKFLRSFGLGNHRRFSAYRRPRPLNTVHLALKFSSW